MEVGFGTGLNFILSFDYCENHQVNLDYTGIEAYPLEKTMIESTNYQQFVSPKTWNKFINKYDNALSNPQPLSAHCNLTIEVGTLQNFYSDKLFDVIYYDAFSVQHQPEMWTNEIIAHACSFIKPGGVFVSYAITGNLKRAVKNAGFTIQKLPGAPGKREMLRAIKG